MAETRSFPRTTRADFTALRKAVRAAIGHDTYTLRVTPTAIDIRLHTWRGVDTAALQTAITTAPTTRQITLDQSETHLQTDPTWRALVSYLADNDSSITREELEADLVTRIQADP